jgi:hypothetical protein
VSFFNRILNFSQDTVRQQEQRRSQRYHVGTELPLGAVLLAPGGGSGGQPDTAHPARVLDVSAIGASVQLEPSTRAAKGDACRLRLSLEGGHVMVDGRVANRRNTAKHVTCGLEFTFADFNAQKSYLQLVEAVALGAMLVPADPQFIRQDSPGLHKEKYTGESDTELTVWRTAAGGPIDSFEFRMNDYFVRGSRHAPVLEVYSQESLKDEHKAGYSAPALHLVSSAEEEIRRLFRWVVPNLSRGVPADARNFLLGFAR